MYLTDARSTEPHLVTTGIPMWQHILLHLLDTTRVKIHDAANTHALSDLRYRNDLGQEALLPTT